MSRPESYELDFFSSGDGPKAVMAIVRLANHQAVNCLLPQDVADEIGSQCDCACLMDEDCSLMGREASARFFEAEAEPSEEV